MSPARKARDNTLIDALEAAPKTKFEGSVWRVVRADRDVLFGSSPKGRWDDGTFNVLYTSVEADGAKAEMYFHIMRGQPIFPSKMEFKLYELDVATEHSLELADMAALKGFGADPSRYGALEYARKDEEYPRMQEIGEAAHFLGFDGLIAPSARWNCRNVVLFVDRVPPAAKNVKKDHGIVDWSSWEKTNKLLFEQFVAT